MGPTAAGKTDLAIALAEHLPCDIISVDSAQIYREMDIGTAKPEAAILARAPHQLLDILDPSEAYSAARFRRDALTAMRHSVAAGRIPLLVGGTMLYFKALLYGISDMPPADPEVRAAIEREACEHGWESVHRQLALHDPVAALRINASDTQRLQRALEVYLVSGKNMTEWQQGRASANAQKCVQTRLAGDLPGNIVQLALAPVDRSVLHRRIEQRFRAMVEGGLVEEVRKLWRRPDLHAGLPSMRSVGYRQVVDYLEGRLDREQMISAGIVATRQLAKRQLTWMRSWRQLNWIQTDAAGSMVQTPEPVVGMTPLEAAIYYLRTASG